jgi:23S rRNA (cytidine1920-2'-O)/16S rRNA (cytidine1409-2'-O)-methyltransferase
MNNPKSLLLNRLLNEGWASSEKEAQALVMTGNILVDDYPASSIREKINAASIIRIRGIEKKNRYVTRAGEKLAAGLSSFGVSAAGKICLDIGAAEGGFTDCLLAHGAAKIYAVDVAYGIFDWQLRNNEKVVVLERTNARFINKELVPDQIDLLTGDVSFISLKKILPPAVKLLSPAGEIIVLFKPQFELPRECIGKNGNVEDTSLINEGIANLSAFLKDYGINIRDTAVSPLRGSNGNVEYLLYGDIR